MISQPPPPNSPVNPFTPWTSFSETVKLIQALSAIPALPVMVFLRSRVGFRRVKLTYIFPIALSIVIFGVFSQNFIFADFGLAFGAMGYFQNWRAWRELTRGELWHTYSDGISWLEYLPLPAFMYQEERIYRFLDPLAGYALSALLWAIPITRSLAFVTFFASVFLSIHQQQGYEYRLNQWLDYNDNQANMMAMSSWSRRAKQHRTGSIPMKQEESYGIATGVGADIRDRIAERRPRVAQAEKELKAYEVTEEGPLAPARVLTDAAPAPAPPAATPAPAVEPVPTEPPAQEQRRRPQDDLDNLD